MRAMVVVVMLAACRDSHQALLDAALPPRDSFCPTPLRSVCNPLTQAGCCAGEKCTWIVAQRDPKFVGYVGCAPSDPADRQVGEVCTYRHAGTRSSEVDDCARGLVCSDPVAGIGFCKQTCDPQGGSWFGCAEAEACVTYPNLFTSSPTTTPGAGVCDPTCDPLADNDFDGSGSAFEKTGSGCGSDHGCYGFPSYGTPPATAFTCRAEQHPTLALRHRSACTEATGCAGPGSSITVESCSQGYLPLLYERSGSTTAVCIALCKPLDCFAGNCGPDNEHRLGEAPHRCTSEDRVGSFDTSPTGEHCLFLWRREVAEDGTFLPSPWSDQLGACMDLSKYRYDSNGDNKITEDDLPLPPCWQLQDGTGSGTDRSDPLTWFGAADLGCVDSSRAAATSARRHDGVRALPAEIRLLRRQR
jgi:hypothetical protein